jgi:hypothetical protein
MLKEIEKFALEIGLDPNPISEKKLSVFTTPYTGLSLRIELLEDELYYYFYHRTTSWTYNGERSDLHDTISSVFSLYLKINNTLSVHIIDVLNPATGEETEIYARYLVPIQLSKQRIVENTSLEFIKTLLADLVFFERLLWQTFGGCPCAECRDRLGYDYDFRWDTINDVKLQYLEKAINGSGIVNYCERTLPTYLYYRDINRKTSIIESDSLLNFLNLLYSSNEKHYDSVESISGNLLIDSEFHHYESFHEVSRLKKIFKSLGTESEIKKVYLENKIISFTQNHLVIRDYNCGLDAFKKEKNKLKIRHEKEFQLLFKPFSLSWVDKIDDETFENLIKDLLQREKKVKWVRKAAHTNERDDGVDLIADMLIQKTFINSENESPFTKIKVIVQCKAYKNGVSKSDVTDIRDTVEYRDYDGYFLAVSSYTKKSLSDHLDKIKRDNKIWIDWWSRDEIEERIKSHEDLLYKYSDLFTH